MTVPTNANFILNSGAADCQIDTEGGIIFGHKLMTKPVNVRKTKPSVKTNG